MVYKACDAFKTQPKQFWGEKPPMIDIPSSSSSSIPQVVEAEWHGKIKMISHYTASIIAHYSNKAANIFGLHTVKASNILT